LLNLSYQSQNIEKLLHMDTENNKALDEFIAGYKQKIGRKIMKENEKINKYANQEKKLDQELGYDQKAQDLSDAQDLSSAQDLEQDSVKDVSIEDNYSPESPVVESPVYQPLSPTYNPTESPPYQPLSPTYNPAESPVYQPLSPTYHPASPLPQSPLQQSPLQVAPAYYPLSPVQAQPVTIDELDFEKINFIKKKPPVEPIALQNILNVEPPEEVVEDSTTESSGDTKKIVLI